MLETILRRKAESGDKTAIVYHGNNYSFSYLDDVSSRLAVRIQRLGIKRNSRITSLISDPVNYVLVFFASLKLGATLFPINPDLEESTIQNAIIHASPSIVIDDFKDRGQRSDALIRESLDEQPLKMEQNFDPEIPVLILLTGGTTGTPKGAVISERSVLWNAFNTNMTWGISSRDISLVSLPLFHTGGWNILLIPTLIAGGKVVFSSTPFNESEILELIPRYNVSFFMGVPTMLEKVVNSSLFDETSLSGITVASGGGLLPRDTIYKLRTKGARVFQGYGLTEAGPNNFYIAPERYTQKPESVGKPCIFVETKIATDGELLIRGPHTFSGYLFGNDENPFDECGYLKTGDIFKADSDGDYYFVGRKKNIIKTGGENVYAAEVESALLSLDYVTDCAVIGVPDKYWGEIVVAFVSVTDERKDVDMRRDLHKLLSSYKIPKRFVILDNIPRTSVGKIDKKRLEELDEKNIHPGL